MKKHFIISLKITFLTLILFGVLYPLAITLVAKFSAGGGDGKTVEVDGKVIGFEVIGQNFYSDKYFNSRPSAVGYNAAATGGSNKGPTNPDYLAQVQARIDKFLLDNPGIAASDIPVDLVTASGGGLDPHISIDAALIQVHRIAVARGLKEEAVRKLVDENTEQPLMGMLGPTGVHVLKLNIALDNLK